ncbi:uncharacterized protein LOC113277869 [Papaver somniferum]|uniref:uncharacterized protein LOC113277869 n=1 Tax=Papaver somniferum TaxID=3469 RepID=UPI000E6F6083|nr:uncharacterized protein LOC113277869 [Papaver somniferum]
MHWITEDVTPPNVPPSQPPSSHLDANPPSDIMSEALSSMSSLIGKKMALISISSPSTNSTPKRSYQQISEDTEMAVDQSSSPPRKIIKQSTGGIIQCWWHIVCGCNVRYRIDNIKSQIFRISAGETIIEVPFSKDFVHFDCPCGYRVELTTNVRRPVKKTKKKVRKKYKSKPIRHL